jgi:K(+)-stimulated pyrophosphate-energized sodium pump
LIKIINIVALLLVPLLPATGWLAVKAPAPIHAPVPPILAPATPVQSLPAQ